MDARSPTGRSQVGIRALVVFVAKVRVATIAAGVVSETAGFPQSQSEEPGERSSDQVTERVRIIDQTGTVESSKIRDLDLYLTKSPGAGDIDLDEATIAQIGPEGSTQLTRTDWSLGGLRI